MADFETEFWGDYGREGVLQTPSGNVETPALFPVINLIGGTTLDSGSIWRHFRDNILDEDSLQGIMFQTMSFLDYGVTPQNLNGMWREKTLEEHLRDRVEMNAPLFVDSGGYRLMNSDTFGHAPEEGGQENDWGLYTDPDSILKLQADYGADIIATLDYPIPQDLKEDEKEDRMIRSIESAIRCLKLIETPDLIEVRHERDNQSIKRLKDKKETGGDPAVFVAIHGHDYETIHWYVMQFLERLQAENVGHSFEGFAIGSLVPLRSSVDILVDIIQGAKDAIPEERREDLALHVFGVGGKQAGVLSLLGVDSFDCSTPVQAAKYRKYIVPGSWERIHVTDLAEQFGEFPCDIEGCPLCSEDWEATDEEGDRLTSEKLDEYISREATWGADGFVKSPYYGWLARHNFEVYNKEIRDVQEAIEEERLLDYVLKMAEEDQDIQQALKYAQLRDAELEDDIEARGRYDMIPGVEMLRDQSKLSEFQSDSSETEKDRRISLEYTPSDFDINSRDYTPDTKNILLILPCSKKKPYGESRTQKVVLNELSDVRDSIHKVTLSGLFGPVPEEYEKEDEIMEYDYVLSREDEMQKELVVNRLAKFLREYKDNYEHVVAYVTSKDYREVIEDAFAEAGVENVFPKNPESRELREHFRQSNIDELTEHLKEINRNC